MLTMKELPDSILVEILFFLTPKELVKCVSPVCKRWRRLCYDASLWREISTEDLPFIHVQDSTIVSLIQHGRAVRKLSLRGCYQISNKVLKEVAINGSRLKHLNVENCFRITDRGLTSLAKSCSQLRTVNLLNTRVTEHSVCELIRSNPNLLEVTTTPGAMTEHTVKTLTTHCKQLEYLHVEQNEFTIMFNNNKTNKLVALTTTMIEMISLNCHLLQVLILRYPITSINDISLTLIGQRCKNLECVEIGQKTYTAPLTDYGVIGLCSSANNLLRLDLTETFITDHTLQAISECCQSLEHLEFGNTAAVSDLGVLSVVNSCLNLDSLCISAGAYSRLTDISVFAIAHSPCSQNLIKLSMNHWDITDFGLSVIAKNLPFLLYVSVEDCKHLTSGGLRYALQFFQSIQSLDLKNTKCVTSDDELVNLSMSLPLNFHAVILKAQVPTSSPAEQRVVITEEGCREFNERLPECEIVFA